jgi:ATP-dependent RNA helicase DeaD
MTNFESFEIPSFLRNSLKDMGISTPTPIQVASIPFALEGRDILASAETGSGKTIAYSLPIISHLTSNPHSSALILAPTRELVIQVKNNLKQLLGTPSSLNIAMLIGGEDMRRQFEQLKKKPRLIIGTPGRICDHLNRGTLKLSNTNFLVLDETDRMLDLGFTDQLEYIVKFLSLERQTFMFSATLPKNITELSRKYLNNPERIQIGEINKPASKIKQQTIETRSVDKFSTLVQELQRKNQGSSAIIFVKTKRNAQELSDQLCKNDFNSEAMHGDLSQNQRERVIKDFRNQRTEIIVATDIAARGLDVPHIEYVFNYHLPDDPENYIHRIGRTGRAGVEGHAISLIAPEDRKKWKEIERLIQGEESSTSFKRNNEKRSFSNEKRSFTSERRSFSSEKSFTPGNRKARSNDKASPFSSQPYNTRNNKFGDKELNKPFEKKFNSHTKKFGSFAQKNSGYEDKFVTTANKSKPSFATSRNRLGSANHSLSENKPKKNFFH